MTTISPAEQNLIDNNNALLNNAKDREKLVEQQHEDYENYIGKLGQLAKAKTPEEAFMIFFAMIATSLNPDQSGGTIMGLEDDDMGIAGKGLLTTASHTKVVNGFQDLTHGTPSGMAKGDDIRLFVKYLDQDIDLLNADPKTSPDAKAVQDSFSPDALTTLKGSLNDLRKLFHVGGDTHDPQTGYYFDPNDSKYIQSFDDLKADMGKKENTTATEAAKDLTDAFSTLSSTTQSINAALNTDISQKTNTSKTVQSWIASMMKNFIDLWKASVQNMSK